MSAFTPQRPFSSGTQFQLQFAMLMRTNNIKLFKLLFQNICELLMGSEILTAAIYGNSYHFSDDV